MNSLQLNAQIPYATETELKYLTYLASELKIGQQVVVIGAGPGVMLLALREGNLSNRITLIDHETCFYAQAHLTQAGLNQNVRYLVSDSSFAGTHWGDQPVAVLIIDGDHSYAGVRRDLFAWGPHLEDKALIFLHDYDATDTQFAEQERYPGVKQAAVEFLKKPVFTFVGIVGTAGIYRKR